MGGMIISNRNSIFSDKEQKETLLRGGEREKISDALKNEAERKYRKEVSESGLYTLIGILERLLVRLRALNINSYRKLERIKGDEQVSKLLLEINQLKQNNS